MNARAPIRILCLALGFLLAACGPSIAPTVTPGRAVPIPPTPIPWQTPREVISVQNAEKVRVLGSLVGHTATVNEFTLARKTSALITRDATGQIIGWNLLTGRSTLSLARTGNARMVIFNATESEVITFGLDRTIQSFNLQGGSMSKLTADQAAIPFFTVSADGSSLALSTERGKLTVWRPPSARGPAFTLPEGTLNNPTALALSSDGGLLAVASLDNALRLYDGKTGAPKGEDAIRLFSDPVTVITFNTAGDRIAVASGETITLIDTTTLKPVAALKDAAHSPTRGVAFSPDGSLIAVGGNQDFLYIWSASGALLARLPGHNSGLTWFGWSPDGKLLASVAYGPRGAAYLWSAESFKPETTEYPRGQISAASQQLYSGAWSPDGRLLLFGDAQGTVFAYGIAGP